ncbi:MAG: hypothetical protein WBY44_00005, partial [Bryobacteraceae bacterium]
MKRIFIAVGVVIFVVVVIVAATVFLTWWRSPKIGHVKDEAMLAGLNAGDFKAADEDYFHDMDSGVSLTADEIKGRNTWIVWTA